MNNDENKTPDAAQPDAAGSDATNPQVVPPTDAETQRLPEQPPVAAPGTPGEADAAPASSGNRRRNILLGVAAGVLLLGIAGGAYAIGTNVGDERADDRSEVASGGDHDGDGDGDGGMPQGGPGGGQGGHDDRHDDDDDSSEGQSGSQGGSSAAADAASLREAADAAVTAADAEGVVSIEVENGGYDIEVRLTDGSEPDVFVSTDGTTQVRTDDDTDDDDNEPLLDLAKLSDLVAAALEAASAEAGTDGTIHSISTSDDASHVYEVDVRMPGGDDVDVELDADLAVVTVDVDA